MYDEYTLSLALFDYVPVALSGLGMILLARWLQSSAALLGTGLIIAGGLSKATWKLLVVVTGVDHVWLANLLFILLAPGFLLVAGATFSRLAGKPEIRAWMTGGALAALSLATAAYLANSQPDARTWVYVLLGMTSLATIGLGGRLIAYGLGRKQRLAALLVVVNLAGVFTLSYLARLEQTAALQWIEEGLNTVTHGALTLAIWLMIRGSMSLAARRAEEG